MLWFLKVERKGCSGLDSRNRRPRGTAAPTVSLLGTTVKATAPSMGQRVSISSGDLLMEAVLIQTRFPLNEHLGLPGSHSDYHGMYVCGGCMQVRLTARFSGKVIWFCATQFRKPLGHSRFTARREFYTGATYTNYSTGLRETQLNSPPPGD